MNSIKGSCHCGSVSWEFDLPIKTVVQCHCSMCRKLQGADYSSYVVVPKEQFSVLSDPSKSTCYQATGVSAKNFCNTCGSPTHLVNGKHFPEDMVLPLGVVQGYSEALSPQIQVYTAEKAEWVNIHDDVPVFS